MLTRETILGGNDLRPVIVSVPAWADCFGDDRVYVRPWSVADYRSLRELSQGRDDVEAAIIQAIHSLCDESGELLFTMDDMPALMRKRGHAMTQLASEINRVNGINVTLETAEKNSATTPS